MQAHETACFARVTRVPPTQINVHAITQGPVSPALLQAADAVLVGGSGAYSVLDEHAWSGDLTRLLRDLCELDKPAWCTCFGFQALALALGGAVEHDPARMEMGGFALQLNDHGESDALTRTLPEPFWVQQGHQDHVVTLPASLRPLAHGTTACEQLVRVQGTRIYASQFHPELRHEDLVYRFQFYAQYYNKDDPTAFRDRLEQLGDAPDTPEVGEMLARLVRS